MNTPKSPRSLRQSISETHTAEFYECSCDDDDIDTPFIELLISLSNIDENVIFAQNGYKKLDKICDTLQGELFKANKISNNNEFVAIKKTDKVQYNEQISIQNDMNFCVSENIVKEGVILKYLTMDNCNEYGNDYIIKYIDFFESDTNYYLVMEYIESQTNLKQFIERAHKYIKSGKLKLKQYQKVIKFIHWQITFTLYWLHDAVRCCHLDLCTENIMLRNCNFIQQTDGLYMINPNISIKIVDFGCCEIFSSSFGGSFDCRKQYISIENESCLAPQINRDELYDARLADMWSLGMILYECMTGKPLIWESSLLTDSNQQRILKQYITRNNKSIKYFNSASFSLLINLLSIDERKRLNVTNTLKHKWFASYYKKYNKRIKTHSIIQKNLSFIHYKLPQY